VGGSSIGGPTLSLSPLLYTSQLSKVARRGLCSKDVPGVTPRELLYSLNHGVPICQVAPVSFRHKD
jgi:hypothetical protein